MPISILIAEAKELLLEIGPEALEMMALKDIEAVVETPRRFPYVGGGRA